MINVETGLQGENRSAAAVGGDSWACLADELDAWADAGRRAEFWWRDDDATRPGPRLDRLLDIAGDHPLCLAVIPALAEPTLAARLRDHNAGGGGVRVLQHGYAHRNNAAPDGKKAEFGDDRPLESMLAEAASGRTRLEVLFGDLLLPVFTPPWNRVCDGLIARLPEAGLYGLSRFGPRGRDEGAAVVNTHLDIVDWRGDRGFAGVEAMLEAAAGHLADRRNGIADPDEPTGLLTHHRDHDEDCWSFIAAILAAVNNHRAARWISFPAGGRP